MMQQRYESVEDYWTKRWEGLIQRVDMLAADFVFTVHNNSLQLLASDNVSKIEWTGYIDDRTCQWCDSHIGNVYRVGQFIPALPAHPRCRCTWKLIPKGEK